MAELSGMQQSRNQQQVKDLQRGIMTIIKPGSIHVSCSGEKASFTYFPNGLGNDLAGCKLFTGIEIQTASLVKLDEFQLLIKATVDSFHGLTDEATLHKLEKTIERVYNDIHGDQAVKINSTRFVHHDPEIDELRYHVMLVECPACHVKTKVVLTWDLVQDRSNNPNSIVKMFFKKDKTDCGHSFIAFIDRALKVKGCEAIDM
ncbi:MAG: hypothetical protein GYA24_25690 [Candidatus Lokiarchaeota archaeon]|nr:hypothetical protein [Candidatus Lokiarchaeota archaeon]